MFNKASWLLMLAAIMVVACAPQSAANTDSPSQAPRPSQSLVMATYAEPGTLAQKALGAGPGTSFYTTLRSFNATLGVVDGQGAPRPYLAENLPQLDTENWRTFPDGRMDTIYRLKANLSWHDGTPLTADDFVFALRVYTSPQVGISNASPQNLIAEAVAPDPRTLIVHWKRPYPDAGVLSQTDFPPLPAHLLQNAFQDDPAGLQKQPFFSREYVGAGPFRLTQWEPGAYIEGAAFDGHALGRPRLDRIRINFMSDANAALAALLAGDIEVATDIALKFDQALILQQEWVPQNKGAVRLRTGSFHGAWFQLRPDLVNPRALLDVRVRKALAHSLNRQDINDVLFAGQGYMTVVPHIPATSTYFAEVDRAAVKYPYDLRATQQLMAEAGFREGPDRIFTSPASGLVHIELRTLVSNERQKEQAVLTSGWRKAGFDFSESLLAAAQSVDSELRATFPAMFTFTQSGGEYAMAHDYSSAAIGSPANRWVGNNRGAWRNEEFDRLSESFADAVAAADRIRFIAQMARVMTENLPGIPISFSLGVDAHVTALQGAQQVANESLFAWNIHQWELV